SLRRPVADAELWRLDVDPSGERVALLTRDNRVWLWNWRVDEAPKVVATLPGEISGGVKYRFGAALEWGPRGKRLLAGHGYGGVLLLDREGETRLSFTDEPAARPRDDAESTPSEEAGGEPEPEKWRAIHATGFDLPRAWSPDGGRLALASARGPLLFDAGTGEEVASGFDLVDGPIESLALDAGCARLLVGQHGGVVSLHDIATKERRWSYAFIDPFWGGHDPQWNPMGVGAVEFSPDGELVAATFNSSVYAVLLGAKTGEQLWTGPQCGGRMGEPSAVVWESDGRGFFHAFVSGVMPVRQVRLTSGEGGGFAGQIDRDRGTLPDIGWNGLAVHVTPKEIRAMDPSTWKPRWTRSARTQ
ncbi:MAG: hypothetical protein AAFP22_06475, partial [Planctomycetota bacterium]